MATTSAASPTASPSSPPATRTRGRPRKVDHAKRRKICVLVASGCDLRQAAFYAGCSYPTIRRETLRHADFRIRLREAMRLRAETNSRSSVDSEFRSAISALQKRLCVAPAESVDDPTTPTTRPP